MKKLVLVAVFCALAAMAYAQQPTATVTPAAAPAVSKEAITLKGVIIDNQCATANKDDLANFVKTHAKQCALACAASGYAIFADGKLYAFDKDSSAKVEEFLKKEGSKLQVVVSANDVNGQLSLISIASQE